MTELLFCCQQKLVINLTGHLVYRRKIFYCSALSFVAINAHQSEAALKSASAAAAPSSPCTVSRCLIRANFLWNTLWQRSHWRSLRSLTMSPGSLNETAHLFEYLIWILLILVPFLGTKIILKINRRSQSSNALRDPCCWSRRRGPGTPGRGWTVNTSWTVNKSPPLPSCSQGPPSRRRLKEQRGRGECKQDAQGQLTFFNPKL